VSVGKHPGEATLAAEVAWACRILAREGYEDLTLGHVSARGENDSMMYIKRKGVALGEVTPDDVLPFDFQDPSADVPRNMHLEAVLHTEVYKSRPDVRCVIHGHPPYATAFSATSADFQCLTHDGVLFMDGLATYDGEPDLIMDEAQGRQVAAALGDGSALLLRNHGVLVAERSIQWTVLTGVLLERSLQLQSIASTFGPLRPIPDSLLKELYARKYQDGFADEYWDAWLRDLRRTNGAFDMPEEAASWKSG